MPVGSGVQPSVGVGDVLDDNGVLWYWQQRSHALQRQLLRLIASTCCEWANRQFFAGTTTILNVEKKKHLSMVGERGRPKDAGLQIQLATREE